MSGLESYESAIARNLDRVSERIEAATTKVGRSPEDIMLLPVTKTVPAAMLSPLPSLGYRALGENRVQEMRQKAGELDDLNIQWHLIGRLQTNKAGQAARTASVVQSVDSVRLAEALSRAATAADKTLTVLAQVNTSGEDAKAGFSPAEAAAALDAIIPLPNLAVRGLMTMAPLGADEATLRHTFAGLRNLRDCLAPQYRGEAELTELSMGMSGDFEIAIEEGATIVRVGSAIFKRP